MALLRRTDTYTLAGVSILAAASAVLILLVVGNRGAIFSNQPIYYSIALLMVVSTPIALLAFIVLSDLLLARPGGMPFPRLRRGGKAEVLPGPGGIEIVERAGGRGALEVSVEAGARSAATGEVDAPDGRELGIAVGSGAQLPGASGAMEAGSAGGAIRDLGSLVREEMARAVSDIAATVKRVSEEVDSMKKQFEEIKSSIEDNMIDVRTLLLEISNPFNYMRRFATDPELSEIGIRVRGGEVHSTSQDAEERSGGDSMVKSTPEPEHATVTHATKGMDSPNNISKSLAELLSGEASIARLMRLILFVGDRLPELGREGLVGLVELSVASGALPKDSMHLVAKVISMIEGSKIPPKRLAVTLYELARSVGVSDKEAELLSTALSGV